MVTRQGFVFVHGINQSQRDLDDMQNMIEGKLKRFDLLKRFQALIGLSQSSTGINAIIRTHVWCAKWRSLGDFMADLEDLYRHKVRREQALHDIKATIREAWKALQEDPNPTGEVKPSLLVCGHSMGQPLSVMALKQLEEELGGKYPMPTSLLTIGGPLGNDDPVVRKYLSEGLDGSPWVRKLSPAKPAALHEWIDVWNPLDPVCHAPILGSSEYPGSEHLLFRVPNQPHIELMRPSALIGKYHSAYFDHSDIYNLSASLLDRLAAL